MIAFITFILGLILGAVLMGSIELSGRPTPEPKPRTTDKIEPTSDGSALWDNDCDWED